MYRHRTGTCHFIVNHHPWDPDRPTLVLIHGAGQQALFWKNQIDGITWKGNILAVDLPGHGRDQTGGRTRIQDYAAWMMAFIQAAKLRTVIPGGISMGGAIALQMLINDPRRFTAGMLINTGARLRVAAAFLELLDRDAAAWREANYQACTFESNRSDDLRRLYDASCNCAVDITGDDLRACDRFDVMASLELITCPVLVLCADQDHMTPPKYSRFLAERIPQSSLATILDAGHLAPMEKPMAVNQAITAFLKGIA